MKGNRFSQIKRVLIGILICNWAVAIAKLIVGFLSQSTSLIADGFHSVADGASNVIGLIGITIASHPADEDHPYGHRKFETLSALVIAALLLIVSFEIMQSSIKRFQGGITPEVTWVSFTVMGVTMLINTFVTIYEKRKGEELKSDLLLADSWHTRSDIFISLSVIVSLVAAKLGLPQLDPVVAFGIALYIGGNAIWILWKSSDVLADKVVIAPEKIREEVIQIPEVKACHEIRSRGREDDVHLDLHVLVDDHMTVEQAHDKSHEIEAHLREAFPGVTDVIIHIEPASHHHDHT